jgi:hypothetical protein
MYNIDSFVCIEEVLAVWQLRVSEVWQEKAVKRTVEKNQWADRN